MYSAQNAFPYTLRYAATFSNTTTGRSNIHRYPGAGMGQSEGSRVWGELGSAVNTLQRCWDDLHAG